MTYPPWAQSSHTCIRHNLDDCKECEDEKLVNQNLRELAEAISGWRNPDPRAQQQRERARRRAWAIRNGKPWKVDQLAKEIELLWGTDTAANIARRLHYGDPDALIRRLYRNGYQALAARMARDIKAGR